MPPFSQFRAAPNLLTLLRLMSIPFLVINILDGHYRTAVTLFLLAGVSDALDGQLARKLQQRTVVGQYLDPIADKLLLSTLFIVLTHEGLIPRYVTILVFSRDLGILLIATLLFATGALRTFPPTAFGKLNTLLQVVTITGIMLSLLFPAAWLHHTTSILLRVIAVCVTVSAMEYGWLILRRLNAPAPKPA